jgi:ubiquinone/menaquinone biosynthesis C-methylase UbiE
VRKSASPKRISDDAFKQAAIEQWTADPCESPGATAEPGSAAYFGQVRALRDEYGPWMPQALDYGGAAGLDVLDVGCGQGIDLVGFARAGARVTGIDLTPRHVELARAHLAATGQEGTVVNGDAESLPFPDESFDRVSSNGVLHHTPNMESALAEIRRVLRPGGHARILVYNKRSLHYWLEQFLWQGVIHRGLLEERSMAGVLSRGVERSSVDARPLVRVYSPRRLRGMLTAAGFRDVDTSVWHFKPVDSFLTQFLARRFPRLAEPPFTDKVAHVAGWYLLGTGSR